MPGVTFWESSSRFSVCSSQGGAVRFELSAVTSTSRAVRCVVDPAHPVSSCAQVCALHPLVDPHRPCVVVPMLATISAIAVSFVDLTDAHGPLGDSVCGLDHTPLDAEWAGCRSQLMPYPLWQYAHSVVSKEPVELLTLDYTEVA